MANIIKFGGAGINKKTTGTYKKGRDFICVNPKYEYDGYMQEVGEKLIFYDDGYGYWTEVKKDFTVNQLAWTESYYKPIYYSGNGYYYYMNTKNLFHYIDSNDNSVSTGSYYYTMHLINGVIFLETASSYSSATTPHCILPSSTTIQKTNLSSYYGSKNGAFAFFNSYYICASYGKFYYSTNGTTWTTSSSTYSFGSGYGTQLDVIGNCCYLSAKTKSSCIYYHSSDGKTWTNILYLPIAYNNGVYLSYGGGAIQRSTDGKTWTAVHTTSITQSAFVYTNGVWVAKSVYSTDNGLTWSSITDTSGTSISVSDVKVASNNILYTSTQISTTNGKTWTVTSYYGITYFNGLFVGYSNGTIYYSTNNGTTWTASGVYFSSSFSFSVVNNLLFCNISSSYGGTLYYSEDGKTWEMTSISGKGAVIGYYRDVYFASMTFDSRRVLMRS